MAQEKGSNREVPLSGKVSAKVSVGVSDLVIVKVETTKRDGTVLTDFHLSEDARQALNTGAEEL
jgi:hypothetical protein